MGGGDLYNLITQLQSLLKLMFCCSLIYYLFIYLFQSWEHT